jgi:hypothetical protein
MLPFVVLAPALLFPALVVAQTLVRDPGVSGPPIEIVHLYNDQWPTGASLYCVTFAPTLT